MPNNIITKGNLENVKRIFYNEVSNFKATLTDDYTYYEAIYDEDIGNLPSFILKNKVLGLIQVIPNNVVKYMFARFVCEKENNTHKIKAYFCSNVSDEVFKKLFDTEGFVFKSYTKEQFYDKFMEVNELFVCDEKLH